MSKRSRSPAIRQKLMRLLKALAAAGIPGVLRTSRRGVPHLVLTIGETRYSVAFFAKTGLWRVFWPYEDIGNQEKRTFPGPDAVQGFLLEVAR